MLELVASPYYTIHVLNTYRLLKQPSREVGSVDADVHAELVGLENLNNSSHSVAQPSPDDRVQSAAD